MKISLNKLMLYSLGIYIASLYIMAYDVRFNLISKALFVLVMGLFVLDIAANGGIRKQGYVYLYFICFAAFALMSCFWSMDFSYTLNRTLTFWQVILLFFVVFNIVRTEEDIHTILTAIFWGGMVMCVSAVFSYGPAYIIHCLVTGVRIGSEINQANAFGFYCTIMVILGLYFAFYKSKKIYLLYLVIPLILGVGSGSRKTILVLVAGIAILFALRSGKINLGRIVFWIGVIAGIFVLLYQIEAFKPLFGRLSSLLEVFSEEGTEDNSALTRFEMISFGWEKFKENPIIGYGTEGYYLLYQKAFGEMRPSHCNYIQILTSFGVIGFVLYYGFYVYVIRTVTKYGFKTSKDLSAFMLTFVVINLISEITTTTITNKFTFIYFALFASYCAVVKQKALDTDVNPVSENRKAETEIKEDF